MNNGLINSLNAMREMSVQENRIYHQYIPIIDETSDISVLASPILNYQAVANDFMQVLIQRIVSTSFDIKRFNNPLRVLEGVGIPVGYTNQEIYVNPAKGRQFNSEDFAGLLQKYEADVKVQYLNVNMDLQYPVTISRHKLKQAFTSWADLNEFIDGITNSLYNGAYINEYQFTKGIVSSAYKDNKAIIEVVNSDLTTRQGMRDFTARLRELYLNMTLPSQLYNSWSKLDGYGRPITTWSNKEDIVILIRSDYQSKLDVNVLALAFNMDKADLLGRIIAVDNFDIINDNGVKVFDGSDIIGFIGDKSWFKIKTQDEQIDEFYNANNRTWQIYLNLTKMYNFSLFANGVILATSKPDIPITALEFEESTLSVNVGETKTIKLNVTPVTGNTPTITFNKVGEYATIDTSDISAISITGTEAGSVTLTASAGETITDTLTITVNAVQGS